VSFFSTLLPGLRELRAPLAAGTVWALALLLVSLRADFNAFGSLETMGHTVPQDLHILLLAGAVYVLGLVAIGIEGYLFDKWLNNGVRRRIRRNRLQRRPDQIFIGEEPKARTMIVSAIEDRVRPLSEFLVSATPKEIVEGEMDLAAMRLSKEAPDQYQQYDRLRAEADFRRALAFPLLAFGVALALHQPWQVGLVTVALSAMVAGLLRSQAREQRETAEELLASAIYFKFTTTPLLETLVAEYGRAWESRETAVSEGEQEAEDYAWLINFLAKRRLSYRKPLFLLQHPSQSRLLDSVMTRLEPSTRREVEQDLREEQNRHPYRGGPTDDTDAGRPS